MNDLAKKADLSRQTPQVAQLLAARLKDNKIDAVPFLRNSLMHHPHDFWLHLEVAEAIPAWDDRRIGHYYGALSIRNDSSSMHNNLAYCLWRVKDLDGADRHFRRALECDPLHAYAHLFLSQTLFELQDLEGAETHYRLASELANKYALSDGLTQHCCQLHAHIGDYGGLQKRDADVRIQHYRRALELDALFAPAYIQLINIARSKNDFKESFHLWKQLLAKQRTSAEGLSGDYRFDAARDVIVYFGSLWPLRKDCRFLLRNG